MIDPENPLKLPKSVDDSRAALDERTVLADTLHHWRNRYGVDPSDMPSVEGSAILAAVTWREALHDDDIVERALSFAADLGSEARDKVVGMLAFVSDAPERARTDTLVAASAARLKRASAIRAAERREAEALKAVEAEPTPKTRRAYREAMEAVDEAHLATPARRRSLSDMVGSSLDRMRAGQGKTCVGILTPLYPKLSNALFGWRGLVVVAAAPGLGKTTLALSAALDAVEANPDTCMLFASFEMPTATLVHPASMAAPPARSLASARRRGAATLGAVAAFTLLTALVRRAGRLFERAVDLAVVLAQFDATNTRHRLALAKFAEPLDGRTPDGEVVPFRLLVPRSPGVHADAERHKLFAVVDLDLGVFAESPDDGRVNHASPFAAVVAASSASSLASVAKSSQMLLIWSCSDVIENVRFRSASWRRSAASQRASTSGCH